VASEEVKICKRPGCGKVVVPHPSGRGRKKVYCSEECRKSEELKRLNQTPSGKARRRRYRSNRTVQSRQRRLAAIGERVCKNPKCGKPIASSEPTHKRYCSIQCQRWYASRCFHAARRPPKRIIVCPCMVCGDGIIRSRTGGSRAAIPRFCKTCRSRNPEMKQANADRHREYGRRPEVAARRRARNKARRENDPAYRETCRARAAAARRTESGRDREKARARNPERKAWKKAYMARKLQADKELAGQLDLVALAHRVKEMT
jgi:hypothetical protein